ncbi:pyruvate kinase [Saprospiraceae bacterium]|nr:pyruvate kinase [Saprospiraceae bacterium]
MKLNDQQNTKIVATVGPASSDRETLKSLIYAGVDVFRLNFSHGTHQDKKEIIDIILELNKELKVHTGILADLQGPKIRIGKMEGEGLELAKGDVITLVNEECIGNREKIYMSYEDFPRDVKEGEIVLVDDGTLQFRVISTDRKSTVKLEAMFAGTLKSNKGVNLPDTITSLPCLTEKDLIDLEYVMTLPVNWIALSFVREAADVKALRKILKKNNNSMQIIAKIEKPEAVDNIDKIIKASDGIMVARGDLGVEVPMERLPMIQKAIVAKCIQKGKPVIVATQMMDSMIHNPSPTRAEITDVANAVLDGTDAVMLSGETATGDHPVTVVEAMNKIILEAEKHYEWRGKRPKPDPKSETFMSDVVCYNAAKTATDIKAKAIVGMTIYGYTAYKISSYRPGCKIYIFSERRLILSTLNLVWGVRCYYYDKFTTTDDTINDLVNILKMRERVQEGDYIVNTGTMPLQERGKTNMMKVTEIQ